MLKIDKDIFEDNLRVTQAYCERQLKNTDKNNASIFRSFNPEFKGQKLFKFKLSDYGLEPEKNYCFLTDWSIEPCSSTNDKFIPDLFDNQLNYKKSVVKSQSDFYKGDILISEIDSTVVDGASAVESGGLIDDYDYPPIDTWFYITKGTQSRLIFSWIPNQFLQFANNAVEVNCVDCIYWFKDAYPEEYKMVIQTQEATGAKPFWARVSEKFKN